MTEVFSSAGIEFNCNPGNAIGSTELHESSHGKTMNEVEREIAKHERR